MRRRARANLCPPCTVDWAQPKQRSHATGGTEPNAATGLDAARLASKQNAAAVAAEIASLIAGTTVVTPRDDCIGAAEGQQHGSADRGTVATGSAQPEIGSDSAPVGQGERQGAGDTNEIQMDDY